MPTRQWGKREGGFYVLSAEKHQAIICGGMMREKIRTGKEKKRTAILELIHLHFQSKIQSWRCSDGIPQRHVLPFVANLPFPSSQLDQWTATYILLHYAPLVQMALSRSMNIEVLPFNQSMDGIWITGTKNHLDGKLDHYIIHNHPYFFSFER